MNRRHASRPRRRLLLKTGFLILIAFSWAVMPALADHGTNGKPNAPRGPAASGAPAPTEVVALQVVPPVPEPLTPADQVFEVEGRLTAQVFDPNPGTSGIQGTLTVNGFTFNVPVGLPIRVSDTPGEVMSFANISQSYPGGFTSLVNRSTIIAVGVWELVDPALGPEGGIIANATDVFIEEAENVLFGVVTGNASDRIFVNGAEVVMETDPRFAPFNSVTDLAGVPLAIGDIPNGSLVAVEGPFRNGVLNARVIEFDGFAPVAPGDDDTLRIDRAELRTDRGELRMRGGINNVAAVLNVSAFDGTNAVTPPIATGIAPVEDGTWRVRITLAAGFAFPTDPPMILVESDHGGSDVIVPVVR